MGLEIELARLGDPDSYLQQTVKTLLRKRDETCAVLREVGFTPIVPDGGYFILADTSAVGKDFDTGPGKEAYDFQFAKWMMIEKVGNSGTSSNPLHRSCSFFGKYKIYPF